MVQSKNKGNTYERVICKELSSLFSDTFTRVPNSGAFVGGKNRQKMVNLREDAQEILSGDIIVPPWFPYSIECKNYSESTGPNLYTLLSNDSKVIDRWIEQSRGDATFSKKRWIVIFKITRKSEYVILDTFEMSKYLIEIDKYIKYKDTIIVDKEYFFKNIFMKICGRHINNDENK